MTEEEIKKGMDDVYAVGVRNGGILMKNKILKALNTDYKLFSTVPEVDFLHKIIKKIDKINPPKASSDNLQI